MDDTRAIEEEVGLGGSLDATAVTMAAEDAATPAGGDEAPDDGRVIRLQAELDSAVEAYRRLLRAANPDVPEELIGGDDVASIEASLGRGRAIVEAVRSRLAVTLALPAGSAGRSVVPSSGRGVERIRAALAGE